MTRQACYLGLKLGQTDIMGLLLDAQATILETVQMAWPDKSAEAALIACVQQAQQKASAQHGQLAAVGVSVPVYVRWTDVAAAPAPAASIGELAGRLTAQTHVPVIVQRHAAMSLYGEFHRGAALSAYNVLLIDLGPDIDAGLILQGRLYPGSSGHAGGFGHMTVNPDGLECECGNIGCLETIASGTNLVRRTKERLFRDHSSSLSSLARPERGELTPYRIAKEALEGDDFALMMIERTGRWIGLAVANVVNLLNLDRVVLAGDMLVADELLLGPVRQEVHKRGLAATTSHVGIVASALGEQAGAIGAALFARDSCAGDA
ncbi:MAG: ROK family protein [Acidobacteriota bacterium]|nr:ROK family protein [Blastocatellia bacterium]MDW8238243.1 ROK family protein [Acidobacteriota bacterium]